MTTPSNPAQLFPVEVVEKHREIANFYWNDLLKFLNNRSLSETLREKQEQNLLPDALGFNLFRLISGIYHRENFHSDIICALLEPTESHGAGHRHVHAFIRWLKTCRDLEGLNIEDFHDVEVSKEKHGRIDILIRNRSAKRRSIIIENKINGAGDMNRQLPRYLDRMEDEGSEVVAIVYLTLNQIKNPDQTTWHAAVGQKRSDFHRLRELLIPTVAFSHDSRSLLEWIQDCERKTNEFETLTALRQYRQLIQHLGAHAMNETITEKFYEEIIKDKNILTNTKSLLEIVNDLPHYRAIRLKREFESRCRPFLEAAIWGNDRVAFLGGSEEYLRIEIRLTPESSILCVWDRDYPEHKLSRIDIIMKETSLSGLLTRCAQHDSIKDINNTWIKSYNFPEGESNLREDIENVICELDRWVKDRRL